MKLTLLGRRVVIVLTVILLIALAIAGYYFGKGLTLLAFIGLFIWSSWSVKYENPDNI